MLRMMIFGTLLTIALIPTGSFAQEPVIISGPVEIKKGPPPESNYESMMATPGRAVVSNRYPIDDRNIYVRMSYRENSPNLKVLTLHHGRFSIDMVKLPTFIKDLETFAKLVKNAKKNENQSLFLKYSENFNLRCYSYRGDKNELIQAVGFDPLFASGGRRGDEQTLEEYINLRKKGYAKLLELKRAK